MPRVNYSDEVFKKTEQVVGKPGIMEPSINEENMRHDPPDVYSSSKFEHDAFQFLTDIA